MEKLLIIGDSIAKGIMFSEEQQKYTISRVDRFERLRAMHVDVQNISQMGATIERGLSVISRAGIADADTTVLFEFGGNDSDYLWPDIAKDPDGDGHLPRTCMDAFVEKYRACIETARGMGAKVVISNLLPINAHRYFDHISRGLSAQNILKWLGAEDMLYRWHEFYNAATERIARDTACPLLDVRDAFLQRHDYQNLLCADGIHPNRDGYVLLNRVMEDQLCPMF